MFLFFPMFVFLSFERSRQIIFTGFALFTLIYIMLFFSFYNFVTIYNLLGNEQTKLDIFMYGPA